MKKLIILLAVVLLLFGCQQENKPESEAVVVEEPVEIPAEDKKEDTKSPETEEKKELSDEEKANENKEDDITETIENEGQGTMHHEVTEEEYAAADVLFEYLGDKIKGPMKILFYGPTDVDTVGIEGYSFAYGEDTEWKFTALEHYIVSGEDIWLMDFLTGEYVKVEK